MGWVCLSVSSEISLIPCLCTSAVRRNLHGVTAKISNRASDLTKTWPWQLVSTGLRLDLSDSRQRPPVGQASHSSGLAGQCHLYINDVLPPCWHNTVIYAPSEKPVQLCPIISSTGHYSAKENSSPSPLFTCWLLGNICPWQVKLWLNSIVPQRRILEMGLCYKSLVG